jgi:hypothetical protein
MEARVRGGVAGPTPSGTPQPRDLHELNSTGLSPRSSGVESLTAWNGNELN